MSSPDPYVFPTDDSVRKVIYLAIMQASKKWPMPIRDWQQAMNPFMVEFEAGFSFMYKLGIYKKLGTGS
jgi:transposase-like protein